MCVCRGSPARRLALGRHDRPARPTLVLPATPQAVCDCVDCSCHTIGLLDLVSSTASGADGRYCVVFDWHRLFSVDPSSLPRRSLLERIICRIPFFDRDRSPHLDTRSGGPRTAAGGDCHVWSCLLAQLRSHSNMGRRGGEPRGRAEPLCRGSYLRNSRATKQKTTPRSDRFAGRSFDRLRRRDWNAGSFARQLPWRKDCLASLYRGGSQFSGVRRPNSPHHPIERTLTPRARRWSLADASTILSSHTLAGDILTTTP